MNEQLLQLARKLKALADQGEGGEKRNAREMLESFMRKHKINYSMLESEVKREREYFVTDEQNQFFCQVVCNVMRSGFDIFLLKGDKKKAKSRFITVTDQEFIEIDAKFTFYWHKWEQDVKTFYKAFIQKNELYSKQTDEENIESTKKLTPQEKADLYRMAIMMDGLEKHRFVRQIRR